MAGAEPAEKGGWDEEADKERWEKHPRTNGEYGREDPNDSERSHFLEVCWSCLFYRQDAHRDVMRIQSSIHNLDQEDLKLWKTNLAEWMAAVNVGIEANADFLKKLPVHEVCGAPMNRMHCMATYNAPDWHRPASKNTSKARTTLRQFVRDWAAEGQVERDATYKPLMDALGRHLPLPAKGARKSRVLCPGSGLGRLPFDLALLGYAAQGNEFSYHMILGSHLMYNRCREVGCFEIYPYILNTVNRKGLQDNLSCVKVPDVCPCLALPRDAEVSMAAGEFVTVYEDQLQEWDAVATAFFLDTAKNPFLYIRTIASILRPGGLWTNLGPLLFHYADVENEISLELSWEELRTFICQFFDIAEEERREANYTMSNRAMMRTVFKCVFFCAIRNDKPVTGKSNAVY